MKKERQSYTLEFKLKAVKLGNQKGILPTASELGTCAENIRRWKRQIEDGELSTSLQQTSKSKVLELKRLRTELRQLKLERDILKKAAGILTSKTSVKFEFIRQHIRHYPIRDTCKILGVSKSGYYQWNDRKPSRRALQNLALIEQIKIIHEPNKKRYGSPRITKELKSSGFHASEKLVRKLMKQA